MMKSNYTGILLCGGKSSRMGSDKYALLFNNKPLYKPALETLHRFCNEVFISSNKYFPEFINYKVLQDEIPDIGPMGGLHTCIKAGKTEYYMALACDMPMVSGTLMFEMIHKKGKFNAIVPIVKNRPEPLYAIYNTSVLPTIEKLIKTGNYSLVNMLQYLNVYYVNSVNCTHELKNVNTPADMFLNG